MRSRTSRPGARAAVTGVLIAAMALTVPAAVAQSADSWRVESAESFVEVAAKRDKDAPRRDMNRVRDADSAVPGELLVRFAHGVSASERGVVRSAVAASLEAKLPARGLEVLRVDTGVKRAVEALERRP